MLRQCFWDTLRTEIMKKAKDSLNLFDYMDYRKFLKDWYENAKKNKRGFSFRSFSKRAGFGSPNFLKRVMEGERNLTEKSIFQVATGLNLNKQETEFFKNLVAFNQADSTKEKNQHYEQILRSKKYSQLKPMEKDQYDFYSNWYHPVIRELIVSDDFGDDYERLASRVYPRLTPQQAKKSVELLQRLGFIKKIDEKRWEQSKSLVTTGAEVFSLVLFNYHQNILELAKHQLFKTSAEKRDMSVLTLGIVKERLPELKKKIQEFRQDILKFVSEDTKPDDVVLLSMQLMPVTQEGSK